MACSPRSRACARLVHERTGEELFLAGLLKLAPHVDEFNFRQGAILDAIIHLDARVLALHGVLPALKRGRGRSEHNDGAGEFGSHHGHIARVVPRGFFLLVALVVFFVDEDETKVGRGREDG